MDFLRIKKISISTLSPVHVGCDEEYEPSNYVIRNGLLYSLDMAAVADGIDPAEKKTLGSLKTVGAIQQFFKSRREKFARFASHVVEVVEEIASEYEEKAGKPVQQNHGGEPVYNLFPIMRTSHHPCDASPCLPGSSLKGSMRTAWLDAANRKHPFRRGRDPKNAHRELQQQLLGYEQGSFENDPFRHLKVADAHHPEDADPAPCRVVYAVSKKKRPSERGSPELKVFVETIHGQIADAFSGELRFTGKIDWSELCDACNDFYVPQLQAELNHPHLSALLDRDWKKVLQDIVSEEMSELRKNRQGFLLRVGRHSGAESVTLNGLRDIKILKKKGEPPDFRPETTEKRFASRTRAADGGLLPFGWIWVESCEDAYQHVSASLKEKLQFWSRPARETYRERMQLVEDARIAREEEERQAVLLRLRQEADAREKAEAEAAKQAMLASMTPNLREIEVLRCEIEKKLAGPKLKESDAFWGGRIKKFAMTAQQSPEWTLDEKIALADMLEEWAGRLMLMDRKDLRKKLGLSALRGLA